MLLIKIVGQLTNSDGLNLYAILDVSSASIVGILVGQNALAAEGVYEGRSAYEMESNISMLIVLGGRVRDAWRRMARRTRRDTEEGGYTCS